MTKQKSFILTIELLVHKNSILWQVCFNKVNITKGAGLVEVLVSELTTEGLEPKINSMFRISRMWNDGDEKSGGNNTNLQVFASCNWSVW